MSGQHEAAPPPPTASGSGDHSPGSNGPGALSRVVDALWRDRGWKGRAGVIAATLILISAAAGNTDQPDEDDTVASSDVTEQTETESTTTTTPDGSDEQDATTTVQVTPPATDTSNELLELLATVDVVASHSPGAPYERDEYQPGGWGDVDGDCMNTRHEVLARDSLDPVDLSADGCFVETGRWIDPYTGAEYTLASDVTIDHHIPLAEGHRAGGWAWDLATKQAFANDLDDVEALTVVGQATNQSKADKAPDEWRPENTDSWCGYATAWLDVKLRWDLSWRQAEVDAVSEMLEGCSGDTAFELSPFAAPATSTTTTPTTTTIVTTPDTPAVVEVLSCSRRSEIVEIANTGGETISLSGWRIHDEGDKHSTSLSDVTLASGERLRLLSGPDTTASGTDIKWTSQHVWNNAGDTAFLLDGSGAIVAQRRCT